jgi:signal transduction histidine kinase
LAEFTRPNLLRRYQRLIELARDLASILDLDALLLRIVRAAADLCEAQEASILLYDQLKSELYFEVATNQDAREMRGVSIPVDSSIAGWIVTNRQPIIVSDAAKDARHFAQIETITNVRTESLLGVPLIANNKVIGALEVINKRLGAFSFDDQDLLTALGAQAAVAIENSRLFHQSDHVSELVHELRTPMASLSTAAHLLLRPELEIEQRKRIVEIIYDETFRISELASSFLDLARLESGRAQFRPESFDVHKLVEDVAGVMQSRVDEKSLTLIQEVHDPLPELNADRDKIKQVLLNLVSNAIKFNSPGGRIQISALAEKGEVVFVVSDTGPGIPPESLPHLFEKFYRVPGAENLASGTGLGLSICKRIVEMHKGEIEVNSRLGEGTTFRVRLPVG